MTPEKITVGNCTVCKAEWPSDEAAVFDPVCPLCGGYAIRFQLSKAAAQALGRGAAAQGFSFVRKSTPRPPAPAFRLEAGEGSDFENSPIPQRPTPRKWEEIRDEMARQAQEIARRVGGAK